MTLNPESTATRRLWIMTIAGTRVGGYMMDSATNEGSLYITLF